MVTVKGYETVAKKDGTSFISLELNGSLEMIQSSNTGRFYATVRRCKIPSTFDAATAEGMVGQKIPGEIVRVSCNPYEYVSKSTGEVLTLQHTYAYQPPGSLQLIGQEPVKELV